MGTPVKIRILELRAVERGHLKRQAADWDGRLFGSQPAGKTSADVESGQKRRLTARRLLPICPDSRTYSEPRALRITAKACFALRENESRRWRPEHRMRGVSQSELFINL
jgi:hypothetical protein